MKNSHIMQIFLVSQLWAIYLCLRNFLFFLQAIVIIFWVENLALFFSHPKFLTRKWKRKVRETGSSSKFQRQKIFIPYFQYNTKNEHQLYNFERWIFFSFFFQIAKEPRDVFRDSIISLRKKTKDHFSFN